MELKSPAFGYGQPIPTRYTCDGEDISPPLEWSDPPANTRSFALIMDDPDAPVGVWDHWVLFNIRSETRSLPEGIPPDADWIQGGRHGRNTQSWGTVAYILPVVPIGISSDCMPWTLPWNSPPAQAWKDTFLLRQN